MSYTLLSLDEIESTSSELKKHYKDYSSFTFLKTNYQTAGRGQFDRVWDSNKGDNLLFSILIKDLPINTLDSIKTWIKTSLIDFLSLYISGITFKEPNDLYVANQKLSGILIESKSSEDLLKYVVIGIGININQIEFGNLNAASLRGLTQKHYDIDALFEQLVYQLLKRYPDYVH